jgi:hypothetical protein
MANYAVIDNNRVVNVIVADLQNIAEEVTGLECIRYDETNPASIGYTYNRISKRFMSPSETEDY